MLGGYSQFRGTLDLGGKASDGAAWRLNSMYENSDGFRNGFHLERYAVNPTATVKTIASAVLPGSSPSMRAYRRISRTAKAKAMREMTPYVGSRKRPISKRNGCTGRS